MNIPLGSGDFAAILDLLQTKRRFLILLHVNPDGDSIGSSIGLGLALIGVGKEVTLVSPDEIPQTYRFLAGSEKFVPPGQVTGRFDAALFLDCGDLERTGPAADLIRLCDVKVNIDHHITNPSYGDLNYIDPTAAAVGEQIYHLISAAGWEITETIANALYASIVTDTGSFRYENTTPDSHLIAAHLLTFGAQPQVISREIYESRSEAATRLLAAALASLRVDGDGTVASVVVRREMYRVSCASDEDAEGLVNYPRAIAGVEVAIAFREVGEQQVRVNLRSKQFVDVSRVAARWGGGGHARAAGCTIQRPLDQARADVVAAAIEAVRGGLPPR